MEKAAISFKQEEAGTVKTAASILKAEELGKISISENQKTFLAILQRGITSISSLQYTDNGKIFKAKDFIITSLTVNPTNNEVIIRGEAQSIINMGSLTLVKEPKEGTKYTIVCNLKEIGKIKD